MTKNCNSFDEILKTIYENVSLKCSLIKSECYSQNCFIEVEPGNYPPRLDFEHKTHTIYEQEEIISDEDRRTTFSFHPKIVRISDIYLKEDYQNRGFTKRIISSIKQTKYNKLENLRYITLYSLPKSVLIWHRIGFEFYDRKHQNKIRDILEDFFAGLQEIDDTMAESYLKNLREIKKELIEKCSSTLEKNINEQIPMYIELT